MIATNAGALERSNEVRDARVLVDNPVVSVLMLAYNHGPYIERAVASVLEQVTTFPFEVIIAEDCSTDDTRELASKCQHKSPDRIRLIVSGCNVGMHANHARAIAASRGEFIAYCEGDDYWVEKSKLQKQVEFMRANPACGLVHGNYLNVIEVGGVWRARLAFRHRRQLEFRAGDIYPALLQANRIQTCTALSRRDLVLRYHAVGPGVGEYRVGDWPEFLYVAHESEIGFINQPLAAYRRTPGSVTNAGAAAAVERGLDAIRMVEDFCEHFGDGEAVRMRALSAQYQTLMRLALVAGDRQRFEQAWAWLSSNDPCALRPWAANAMRRLIAMPNLTRSLVQTFFRFEAMLHQVTFRRTGTRDGHKWGGTWA